MTAAAKPWFAAAKGTWIAGYLPAIWRAVAQEAIDLLAVLNAVRVALPTEDLKDY